MSPTPSLVAPPTRGSITGRAVVLALVLGAVGVMLAMPMRAWMAQRAEIASLQADVDNARARVAELQVLKERWNDPAFIAAEARRRLHFVLPGEIGFTTITADGKPLIETLAAAKALSTMTWTEKLWGALQEADDATDPLAMRFIANPSVLPESMPAGLIAPQPVADPTLPTD